MKITHAMVLAAGLGTRMRPITNTMPKPLVAIAGRPMIDYVLDILVAAGVEQVVINVHHFAEQMEAHLAGYHGLNILISDEREALMNSGGGLVKGLKLLDRSPAFVMNADLFWIGDESADKSNLSLLADFFDPARMDMALLCVPLERTTGHNGKKDFSLGADGRLKRYTEGDPAPVVYAGAIALLPELFDDAPQDAFNLNIYFDRAIARSRLYSVEMAGQWLTVGTPEAISEAEETIRRFPPADSDGA
ncbi:MULTISPECIES: nucleotidyltransferase family protein [Alphaproteobacteria]|uniref:Mannose-1-phosphate guanylyltransferase n=2 Tax=Alphaproteobacteria TaxID=28211 RepID=A0A512HME9_9HYPH|nr:MULTISPECIES: nucleotidyltransferase family protein [Alphaproteobacteria]GEO86570.1 mannose-1-phosphate guanylyltransferase [Ciceribacter naphthalenivorans]GLR20858.1 mannose-1-phosphate guanylyltransferase [Ciceribacter naphthalenivorans]GLT03714.1 mannose-1-phosphate guanylyltransferase [Sphingomonas psychrolutea]